MGREVFIKMTNASDGSRMLVSERTIAWIEEDNEGCIIFTNATSDDTFGKSNVIRLHVKESIEYFSRNVETTMFSTFNTEKND